VMVKKTKRYIHVMVLERELVSSSESPRRLAVNAALTTLGPPCNLRRSIGNRANDCTENRDNANTEMSSVKRDARTTEDDMAALMDRTEDSF